MGNIRTRFFIFTFIIFTLLFSSTVGAGALTNDKMIEEYVIDDIFAAYNSNGGFSNEFSGIVTIEDILDALEALQFSGDLNNLTNTQRNAIRSYILDLREIISPDDNSTDTIFIDWWGNIESSVKSLRVLQLINRSDQTLIDAVKTRILKEYIDTGLRWNVGEEGWADTFWGLFQPIEWDLFHLTSDLGIIPLTSELTKVLNSEPLVEINPQTIKTIDQRVFWEEEIFTTFNSSTDKVGNLKYPIKSPLIPEWDLFVPQSKIIVSWDEIWDENGNFQLDNQENSTYAEEFGLIENRNIIHSELIELSNNAIMEKTITEEKEVWDYSSLFYDIEISLVNDKGDVLTSEFYPLNTGVSSFELILEDLNTSHQYFIELNTTQTIHALTEYRYNLTEEITNSTVNIPPIEEIVYEWVEKVVPITVPLQFQHQIPSYGKTHYFHPTDDVYAFVNSPNKYYYYISELTPSSWNDDSIQAIITEGGKQSLGINTRGAYNILIWPVDSTPVGGINQISLELINLTNNLNTFLTGVEEYLDLFNQSSTDPNEILQQINMLNMLTYDIKLTEIIDKVDLIQPLFYFYNTTTGLFADSLRTTIDTWNTLDKLGVSQEYFNKDHYEKVFNYTIDNYYHEEIEKSNIVTDISIYDETDRTKDVRFSRLFIELITYNESWKYVDTQFDRRMAVFEDIIGIGLNTQIVTKDSVTLLAEAQEEVYQRLLEEEKIESIDKVFNQGTTIQCTHTNIIPQELLYWKPETTKPTFIDTIYNIIIGLCIVVSIVIGLIAPDNPKGQKIFSIMMILLISLQALAEPLLSSEFMGTLSDLIRASAILIESLEEGIYDITNEFGDLIDLEIINNEELLFLHLKEFSPNLQTATSVVENNFTIRGKTTEELYENYKEEITLTNQKIQRHQYSTDGITSMVYIQYDVTSYQNYLFEIKDIIFFIAFSF